MVMSALSVALLIVLIWQTFAPVNALLIFWEALFLARSARPA